jgi:hypothetical protein
MEDKIFTREAEDRFPEEMLELSTPRLIIYQAANPVFLWG